MMENTSSLEAHFPVRTLQVIDTRLNDVAYACQLLSRVGEIRDSKLIPITYSVMSAEEQAAAAQAGIFPGSVDIFTLGVNSIKELRARRLERIANDILED